MNIVVCIKQVPNTTEIKIDPITNTLKREGVESIMNPDDKAALETALRLKEQSGAHITALCMGPMQAKKVLAEALAMGADRAILLSDRVFAGSDTLATSRILAAALKKLDYQLIVAGRQAIDGDTAQVGPQIAEHLSLPQVTYAADIAYSPKTKLFTVKQVTEDRSRVYECPAPLLVTVLSSHVSARYMETGLLVDLKDKEAEVWTAGNIDVDAEKIGLKGSPTKVKESFAKTVSVQKEIIDTEPAEAARIIAEKLKEKHII